MAATMSPAIAAACARLTVGHKLPHKSVHKWIDNRIQASIAVCAGLDNAVLFEHGEVL